MTVPTSMESSLLPETGIDRLLKKCEELVCQFQYELALKFCEKILQEAPQNINVRMMKATIYIDSGEEDAAREVLWEAVGLEPNIGAEKYIALAQLCKGQQALELFQKAINILVTEDPIEDSAYVLSSLYCSMAELYMTDLCMEVDAEGHCEGFLEKAQAVCPENYEVLQSMANMKISQSRPDEALKVLSQSISMWKVIPFGKCLQLPSSNYTNGLDNDEYPSFEFRLICSRLLVELQQWETAKEILEVLAQEDDEIPEVWYLLALILHASNQVDDSKASLECAIRLLKREGLQSTEMLEAISELQSALGMDVEYKRVRNDGEGDCVESSVDEMDI